MRWDYWTVEPLWAGEACAILGGGPSLTPTDVDACRGRVRVIAVNDALRLAPWADLHWFCDHKWWQWHHAQPWYREFRGIRATLGNEHVREAEAKLLNAAQAAEPRLRAVRNRGRAGLCAEPDGVHTGNNGGYQAINLAVHLGVRAILLLGFDMRWVNGRSHWFGDHPQPTPADAPREMLKLFPTLVAPLAAHGVRVLNCTPGSALGVFPKMRLAEALDTCAAPGA